MNAITSYYFVIRVQTKMGGDLVEFLKWSDLRFELRMKYDWYFKYRAALLQVKYPKYEVNTFWGQEKPSERTFGQIMDARIRSKKSKICEYKNKLEKAKASWSYIFPIEDDPLFQKAVDKIARLEKELTELESSKIL